MVNNPEKPNVFISYAHEGDLSDKVRELADWLFEQGVEVVTDHPHANRAPAIGWRAWMQHSVEDADFVLIVCSERYKKLFEKREIPEDSGGRGVTWESAIITD
ncbi:toll/interleukin-1 receptor domain-containing protein, partial [Desulfosarcina sp. OttesenSCG-928-B08]|nr:toll/interleukin-1 receptor domain-containing protein [Desulfosarcina sp. OttesenSCG-928-B08]